MLVNEEYITCGDLIRMLDAQVEIINAANSEESHLNFEDELLRLHSFENELNDKTKNLFKVLPDVEEVYTALAFLDKKLSFCRQSCLRGSRQYSTILPSLNPDHLPKIVYLLQMLRVLEDYKEYLQFIIQSASPFQVPLELFRIPAGIDPEDIGAQTIPVSLLSAEGTEDLEQAYLKRITGDTSEKKAEEKVPHEPAVYRITVAKQAYQRGSDFLKSLKITGVYRLIAEVVGSDEDYVSGQFRQRDCGRFTSPLHEPRADAFLDSLPKY